MPYLIHTSVAIRLANVTDANHKVAAQAVLELHRRGEDVRLTSQVLVEFWNAATRPITLNELGLLPADAELQVIGKQVHDARLVAVCHVHAITHALTFNVGHFTRLAGFGPGVIVVHPARV